MPNTALMLPHNLSHNVPAIVEAAKTHLTNLAKLYRVTEVAHQSRATLDAKRRDLQRFIAFYHQLYDHARPEEWFVSVTTAADAEDPTRHPSLAADPHGRGQWRLGSDIPGVVSGVPCLPPANGSVTPRDQTLSRLPRSTMPFASSMRWSLFMFPA